MQELIKATDSALLGEESTVRNIQQRGLTCAGVILNYAHDERDAASISNRMVLQQFLNVPVVAEVMHGEEQMDWPAELAL